MRLGVESQAEAEARLNERRPESGIEVYNRMRSDWIERGFKTLRDLLVYYAAMDVEPLVMLRSEHLTKMQPFLSLAFLRQKSMLKVHA